MRITLLIHLLGLSLLFLGATMFLSLGVSWYYQDEAFVAMLWSCGLTVGIGSILTLLPYERSSLERREGLVAVPVLWCMVTLFGSLPFLLSGAVPTFTDAFFESMSGFTTTGATVFTHIDDQPQAILFWRSWIQWIGGMGIIVLFLAIFPLFGVGVLQLYRGEVPGPTPDRLVPKLGQTAKLLWSVYVIVSACELLLLWAGGMTFYDATLHTFTTMATGGFSSKARSIGAYNSVYIESVIIVFMILAGTNFSLHFWALGSRLRVYWRDPEWRFYFGVVVVSTLILTLFLTLKTDQQWPQAIRYSLFQVVAIMTTTGYASTDFEQWPVFGQFVLVLLMFFGGCAGSTGGGMKHARIILLMKHSYWQLYRMLHPRAVASLRLGQQNVSADVLIAVQAFFLLYVASFALTTLALTLLGVDIITALTAAASTLGNIGPGLERIGPFDDYSWLPATAKWLLSACMLLGRLEFTALLVLCLPSFWKA
jgi:trk system potassium uptake protein TrkH